MDFRYLITGTGRFSNWIRRTLLIASLAFTSCHDEEPVKNEVLVESNTFLTRSASELRNFIVAGGLDLPVDELQYNVQLMNVTYHTTTFDGGVITASGIVIVPSTTDGVSMVSFQHGTITANSEAPTQLPLNSQQTILYAALASAGFITVVPDFIGFGSSLGVMHPYYVYEPTATAVVDNIKAASELARSLGINFNSKLFLAGYSQGGYATMATHKYIQTEGLPGFSLIASFPAAGGYDIKGMQAYFFDREEYANPYYLAYVARAYQVTYDWDQPLSNFFKEPYASRIPDLFDGSKTAGQINAQLTTTVADLITEDIHMNIDTDPQYAYLVNAFEANSVDDWIPNVPVFMYHGDADITVPYENSVQVYEHFISNGASQEMVHLITIPGADHGSGVIPYAEDFVQRMIDLSR